MNSLNLEYSTVEETKNLLIETLKNQNKEDPFRESMLVFDRLLYPDFAYNHPIIGSEEDLKSITVKDVRNFYNTYYKPNNAVLCITGNIDEEDTLNLVRKYFSTIDPSKNVPPAPSFKGDFTQWDGDYAVAGKPLSRLYVKNESTCRHGYARYEHQQVPVCFFSFENRID